MTEASGLEDGRRVISQEMQLKKLEKAGKQVLPWSLWKEDGLADTLARESDIGLLTSRTIRE